MKKKTIAVFTAMVFTVSMAIPTFAATYETPAEICMDVTGLSLDTVIEQRLQGKTYGTIADEAGKLDEFKEYMLEIKEERIAELVEDGTISQSEGNEMLEIIYEHQSICDGTGNGGMNLGLGLGRGRGGRGAGLGMGGGMRLRDGSCYYYN